MCELNTFFMLFICVSAMLLVLAYDLHMNEQADKQKHENWNAIKHCLKTHIPYTRRVVEEHYNLKLI